jgi:hypothetical protein
MVKALSSFENMESHGEPIKPILCHLITWTSPKEGITLLKFFDWHAPKFLDRLIWGFNYGEMQKELELGAAPNFQH